MKIDAELDTSGLACPLPILEAKKFLRDWHAGAVVRIISTDPQAQDDFVSFAAVTGHHLLGMYDVSGRYYFIFRCRFA